MDKKTLRNNKIREDRNSGMTLEEIGRKYCITRARVCQICKQEPVRAGKSEGYGRMNDQISRQAAIDAALSAADDWDGGCNKSRDKYITNALLDLPSVHPKLPENWWKTDHGYMWLCPHCGLPVHSDFEECLRCGIKRQSAQSEFARDINVPCTETAERTAKTSQNVPNDDLISRKAAIEIASGFCHPANIAKELEQLPSVQPEIIRCRDCKFYDGRPCGIVDWYNTADDFCSRAERRTDE